MYMCLGRYLRERERWGEISQRKDSRKGMEMDIKILFAAPEPNPTMIETEKKSHDYLTCNY